MDIKDLDKKQYILLILLITFVVSIATGIVTVSLMNQAPKSVPQTINNVIQRTIEKVTTVEVPTPTEDKTMSSVEDSKDSLSTLFGSNSDALVSIYNADVKQAADTTTPPTTTSPSTTPVTPQANTAPVAIGQGVIISDIGLILVDSSILGEQELYKVVLDKTDFNVSVLKKFTNGFTILKISAITDKPVDKTPAKTTDTGNKPQ